MKKKYDIKTTDVETLKKWYHLMTIPACLGRKGTVLPVAIFGLVLSCSLCRA